MMSKEIENSSDENNLSDKKKYPSDDQIRKTIRLSDKQAANWDYKLVQWVLSDENIELVRQVRDGNLVSSDNPSDEKILLDCILEFNKLMSKIRPQIPLEINKNKIMEGVKLSSQKNRI